MTRSQVNVRYTARSAYEHTHDRGALVSLMEPETSEPMEAGNASPKSGEEALSLEHRGRELGDEANMTTDRTRDSETLLARVSAMEAQVVALTSWKTQ